MSWHYEEIKFLCLLFTNKTSFKVTLYLGHTDPEAEMSNRLIYSPQHRYFGLFTSNPPSIIGGTGTQL